MSPPNEQLHEVEWLRGGRWPSGHVLLQWLCIRNLGLFELEKERGVDERSRTNGLTSALRIQQQQPTQSRDSHIKSTQPAHHPAMTVLIVEKECEVERMRGGCFPCRNGKVTADFGGQDGGPGIQPQMPVPERAMQFPSATGPPEPERKPGSDDQKQPKDSSRPTEPTQSRHSSRPTQPPQPQLEMVAVQTPALAAGPSRTRVGSAFVGPTQPREHVRDRRAISQISRPQKSIPSKADLTSP